MSDLSISFQKMEDWLPGSHRPVIISGPCSAESEEQVIATAEGLKDASISLFRAGLWKPRTRPDSFEGVGSIGLPWLAEVKRRTGLKTTVEVANAKHVEEVLLHGIDVLWIGARTSANPFAIQEIADAIRGTDIPVLIKNPINPDLDLWIGGIERIAKAGITKVAAIHRGFSTYGHSKYRNMPQWQIPIDLMRLLPDLPILCDPSHISGNRQFIREISQKALDLNFDGLMIECHINPDNALSDADQQLTPVALTVVLSQLILRDRFSNNEFVSQTLLELRNQIDQLDDELLQLLEKRMGISEIIGDFKKTNNITILQAKRWAEIIQSAIQKGTKKNLSTLFLTRIFQAIHQESINHQMKVMNEKEKESYELQ